MHNWHCASFVQQLGLLVVSLLIVCVSTNITVTHFSQISRPCPDRCTWLKVYISFNALAAHCIFTSEGFVECSFLGVCVSPGLFLPSMTLSFFCTNLWQQQQLLRPSLLRPEVETSHFSSFKGIVLVVPVCAAAAALLVLRPSFEQCWVISLFASLNHRNSPWSQVSTPARITMHKTTIITIKGEHAAVCQPRHLTVFLRSQTLVSIVLFKEFTRAQSSSSRCFSAALKVKLKF